MAEPIIIIEASDLHLLGAGFHAHSSTTATPSNTVENMDKSGNIACARTIEDAIQYTQTASYCGNDLVGDLGTFLTKFGSIQNAKKIDSLSITFNHTGYCEISINSHNHIVDPHLVANDLALGYADVSDMLPHAVGESYEASDGFGIEDFGITTGGSASPQSCTVSFSIDHADRQKPNGDHFAGKSITPRCDLSMTFEGVPTSNTKALLSADFLVLTGGLLTPVIQDITLGDSNTDPDSFEFTAQSTPDLAVA